MTVAMANNTNSTKTMENEGATVKLHLKLPVVTCEKRFANNPNNVSNGDRDPYLELDLLDRASSADADNDEEDLFCRQHLMPEKKRMSSELRDLYEVLQQLPVFVNGKRSENYSRERTRRWVASSTSTSSMSNKNPYGNGKQREISARSSSSPSSFLTLHLPPYHDVTNKTNDSPRRPLISPFQSLSTSPDCCAVCIENSTGSKDHSKRKAMKMHDINLYNSILPPTIFTSSCRRLRRK